MLNTNCEIINIKKNMSTIYLGLPAKQCQERWQALHPDDIYSTFVSHDEHSCLMDSNRWDRFQDNSLGNQFQTKMKEETLKPYNVQVALTKPDGTYVLDVKAHFKFKQHASDNGFVLKTFASQNFIRLGEEIWDRNGEPTFATGFTAKAGKPHEMKIGVTPQTAGWKPGDWYEMEEQGATIGFSAKPHKNNAGFPLSSQKQNDNGEHQKYCIQATCGNIVLKTGNFLIISRPQEKEMALKRLNQPHARRKRKRKNNKVDKTIEKYQNIIHRMEEDNEVLEEKVEELVTILNNAIKQLKLGINLSDDPLLKMLVQTLTQNLNKSIHKKQKVMNFEL